VVVTSSAGTSELVTSFFIAVSAANCVSVSKKFCPS
jgi:hypothetical protein